MLCLEGDTPKEELHHVALERRRALAHRVLRLPKGFWVLFYWGGKLSEAFKRGSDRIWAAYLKDHSGCIVKNELQCWGSWRQEWEQDSLLGSYYRGLARFMVIKHEEWQWRCWERDGLGNHPAEMGRTCLGAEFKRCALGVLSQDMYQTEKQCCKRDTSTASVALVAAPYGAVLGSSVPTSQML